MTKIYIALSMVMVMLMLITAKYLQTATKSSFRHLLLSARVVGFLCGCLVPRYLYLHCRVFFSIDTSASKWGEYICNSLVHSLSHIVIKL